ncbi:MAG: tRNA (uridine(34)/cytosine(34)/5-carboxymethylaminomethyluridine(34)-2'-O)-methyltransferase TrmL [Burkholderiaceae bacterium]
MFNVVLVQPEIPPNTGNVIRMCANSGASLHLVAPLGFSLEHSRLRRAGLDYHEFASIRVHPDWDAYLENTRPSRLFALSTRGRRRPSDCRFEPGDHFVFGAETCGLPDTILDSVPAANRLRLPMRPGSRSLNLSNSVAIVVYEAWRQQDYAGAAEPLSE